MAIAFVQHASSNTNFATGTATTNTPTFVSNAASGNCLVAAITAGWGTALTAPVIASVSTNGTAENWVLAKSVFLDSSAQGDGGQTIAIWVNPGTGGGQKIIDVNCTWGTALSGGNDATVFVDTYEISGLNLTSVTDKTASGLGAAAATTFSSTATATTAQPVEIAIGVVGTNGFTITPTITGPSSPWVNETTLTGTYDSASVFCGHRSGYNILSTAAAITFSGTLTGGDGGNGAVVVTLLGSTAAPVFPSNSAIQPVSIIPARIGWLGANHSR